MKKTGLFFGIETNKTADVAKMIQKAFKEAGSELDVMPVENASQDDFEGYDNLILGSATWFDGELPPHWDEAVPALSSANLKNKRVAIFGLGDQENYSENFADGVGILADALEPTHAKLVGFTSPEGYYFDHSKALKNGKFQGLVLDIENQSEKTPQRITDWVKQLIKEFV